MTEQTSPIFFIEGDPKGKTIVKTFSPLGSLVFFSEDAVRYFVIKKSQKKLRRRLQKRLQNPESFLDSSFQEELFRKIGLNEFFRGEIKERSGFSAVHFSRRERRFFNCCERVKKVYFYSFFKIFPKKISFSNQLLFAFSQKAFYSKNRFAASKEKTTFRRSHPS